MAIEITDLGVWQQYYREDVEGFPPNTLFAQAANGTDWYDFRKTWPAGVLCALGFPMGDGWEAPCNLQSVVWNAGDSAVPLGLRVLQIAGHDTSDPKPWKSYQHKLYDPMTGAITDPPNTTPVITYKADIWRRMTSEEATMIYADLQDADVRLRATFEAAQFIDHSDDLFPTLLGAITARLGAARAAVILAPS